MADSGYRWWYIDAQSDDGQHALTLIAFIGSVFSPYYAWQRRRRERVPAAEHCALNAVFYGPGGSKYWSMTERGAGDLQRSRHQLSIGPSALQWSGDSLVIDLDERCCPLPRRLRGQVRLHAPMLRESVYTLDGKGRHHWQAIAPVARVEVELTQPALHWSGAAYWDSNHGAEALERGFRDWHWSRAHLRDGSCAVLYRLRGHSGRWQQLALRLPPSGPASELAVPPSIALPASRVWRIRRAAQATDGRAGVSRTLEDTPFYCRSLLRATLGDESVSAVHESLDLQRFASPWVQALLPFRMPRRSLS